MTKVMVMKIYSRQRDETIAPKRNPNSRTIPFSQRVMEETVLAPFLVMGKLDQRWRLSAKNASP